MITFKKTDMDRCVEILDDFYERGLGDVADILVVLRGYGFDWKQVARERTKRNVTD